MSVVAVAAALTLVTGMAPAYAEETPLPDTAAATTEDTTELEASAAPEPAPESAPEPGPEPAPEEIPEEAADQVLAEDPVVEEVVPVKRKASLTPGPTAAAAVEEQLVVTVPCQPGTAVIVGGFQIDADTCAEGGMDWDNTGLSHEDGFAPEDTTGFSGGASENDDPASWTIGDTDPNGKTDFGTVWGFSHNSGGQVYAYFGVTIDSTSGGTSQYDLEFNRIKTGGVPTRSVGDLLFRFVSSGSGGATFTDVKIYRLMSDPLWNKSCFEVGALGAGWCTIAIPAGAFTTAVSADSTFIEGAINVSTLFGSIGCSGVFGQTSLRSVTGNAFATSALKDYVRPLGITTPSTCASLLIEKRDAANGSLLPGAEFDVYAGTGTGGARLYDNVKDGDAADKDPAAGQILLAGVEPGTYTVVERVAPTGYFLPFPHPQQTLTVPESGSVTFTFEDVRRWEALDVTKDAAGSYTITYPWDIQKTVGDSESATEWFETLTKRVGDDGDGQTGDSFGYQVVVTQSAARTSAIEVRGTVLVDNPNDLPVDITLTDELEGATCSFADSTVTVPAEAVDQPYSYTCTYPNGTSPAGLDNENLVTIEWDKSTYPQEIAHVDDAGNYTDSDTDPVEWDVTEENRTVTITDDRHVFDPAWTITWSGAGVQETRTYEETVSSGAGDCHTQPNTAFVKDRGTTLDSDDASARVCVGEDLFISKVSEQSVTRAYGWSVTKNLKGDSTLIVDPGTGEGTAMYDILVTAGAATDRDRTMTGTITVSNPNLWQDVVINGLADDYLGSAADDCAIDNWAALSVADRTIPRRVGGTIGTRTFGYTCDFADDQALDLSNINRATVTWDAAIAHTPTGSDSFDLPVAESAWTFDAETDKTIEVWDDNAGTQPPELIGMVDWTAEGATKSFSHSITVSAPPGDCEPYTNTATIEGDGDVVLDSDTADVTACNLMQDLTVTNEAAGSYAANYLWDIEKVVRVGDGDWGEDAERAVADDGTGATSRAFEYELRVTHGAQQTSNIEVTGRVLIDNPNVIAVVVVLSDELADGTDCSFEDDTVTVPAGAVDAAYEYTCAYPDGTAPADLATRNDVTVTWDKSTYAQTVEDTQLEGDYSATADDTVEWTEKATNKTVTITDDHHEFAPGWTITWTADGAVDKRRYTRSLATDAGTCVTETNTAFVKHGRTTHDQDSATATICVGADLVITKLSAESLTRSYPWDITKDAEDVELTADPATGEVTATYDILVTAGAFADTLWEMSGTITVSNPNRWQDVVLTGLTDVYSGGGADDCAIDGWDSLTTTERTIPRRVGDTAGAKTFTYTCVFDERPLYVGTNTATVTWDKTTAATPNGTASHGLEIVKADWSLDAEIDRTVTVWDDNAGTRPPEQIGTAVWTAEGATTPFEHSIVLSAAPGDCETYRNTATAKGEGGDVLDSDPAEVTVCNPQDLVVGKTASGSFERTYDWDLVKEVSADGGQTWGPTASSGPIDVFTHEFDYRVTLVQQPWDDHDFRINGTITIDNPNTDPAIPAQSTTLTEAPGVTGDVTCVVVGGPYDGMEIDGLVVGPVGSDDAAVTVDYECELAVDPATSSYEDVENVVTATNASTPSATATFDFVLGEVHNETATVTDNKVDQAPVTLGTEEYNESNNGVHSYSYEYSLTHTADSTDCDNEFQNTAVATTGSGLDLVVVGPRQTTATVCPNPGTWRVEKTSSADGPVAVGTVLTYTLTAEKTGGVNPENVVVTDDLGDLLEHATGPTDITATNGAVNVSVSPEGVLTWNIAELAGTETVTFKMRVGTDADDFGVSLPNLVVSPGSENCPNPTQAAEADECDTNSDTPAYDLDKSSDAGPTVMPPYLGAPGDRLTYSLTVTNTSDAPINPTTMRDATVTDDLSDVLDDASFVEGSITGDGVASRTGNTLTWTLPVIPVGGTATIGYQVVVNEGAWNQDLVNTATPGPGGACIEEGECTTSTVTPPITQMQVRKVNAETGAPLAGAGFTLYEDNEPFADPAAPAIGAEDDEISTATSGDKGLAVFPAQLVKGHFLVQETEAPEGYALPVDGDTMAVEITDANFVPMGTMAPFEFRDPAEGQIAIIAKRQFERDAEGEWEVSDGVVDYGDELRYVVEVKATGPKIFHDVLVTDYVPGFNPLDTVTKTQAALVPGSATCSASLTCEVSVNKDNLVSWKLGTVTEAVGFIEMVVKFPEAPESPAFDANGEYINSWWNVGYLRWFEVQFTPTANRVERAFGRLAPLAEQNMVRHDLTSNEVVVRATRTRPPMVDPPAVNPPAANPPAANPPAANPPAVNPPAVNPPGANPPLPSTGGPAAWLPLTGIGLVVLGAWLLLQTRLRRRRV